MPSSGLSISPVRLLTGENCTGEKAQRGNDGAAARSAGIHVRREMSREVIVMELCACPQCGLPAEVIGETSGPRARTTLELVGVRCIERHWFLGPRDRLIA
jgi:hypothetical protein